MRRYVALLATLASLTACGRPSPSRDPAANIPMVPTYSKDVAPILSANCATCHQPGQGAPFNLLSYADAQPRARAIADMTSRKIMPPWLADPIEPAFEGERRLSAQQIGVLQRWAETGATAGDAPAPASPTTPEPAWALGTPDLILRPARAYSVAPGDLDIFRNLVIRTALPADRFVRAVEFRPGDAPIHHAVVHLDRTGASRAKDGADGQPGFDGMAMGTQDPDGHFIGWAPGRGAIVAAEGRPWRLAKGTDLVVELHLMPQSQPASVQPTIGLYFSDGSSSAAPFMLKMGSNAIDIPAGATDYVVEDTYQLPVDVSVLSVYPHAHYLGKDMLVQAVLPGGQTRTLLHIPRWSFHWQQDYRYTKPLDLPRGTTIRMRFTYDNSDANEENPSHPPVRVVAGQRSTDEMGNLLLQLATASPAERTTLQRDVAIRDAQASVAAAELLTRSTPATAETLTSLGAAYVDAGRVDDGIAALNRALRLDGNSWKAHNELGGAFFKAGRGMEAVAEFRKASRLRPTEASVQFNLGKALAATGVGNEAFTALSQAVRLNPEFAEAHDELGVLLFARGRVAEAIVHLRRAVALSPDSSIAHSDLGGALAQAGQRDEALVHINLALTLDPGNSAARENLARLRGGR